MFTPNLILHQIGTTIRLRDTIFNIQIWWLCQNTSLVICEQQRHIIINGLLAIGCIFSEYAGVNLIWSHYSLSIIFEVSFSSDQTHNGPHNEKTCLLHMRKQRRRSDVR